MKATKGIALSALLVVATVTGVTFATVPAAAQSETTLGDVLDGADDAGGAVWSAIGGYQDRSWWWLSQQMDSSDRSASEEVNGVATYFNANNETLIAYANERGNWSNETLEFSLHMNGETEVWYVVATANSSTENLTSARMVSSTNRTASEVLEVCGYAADQSHEELEYFVANFAEPNKSVDTEYKGRMKGRYGPYVETSLYPSSGDCSAAGGEA